jgi:pimeloyl-[acyl-carrier protein] methyl ester esterase
MWLLKHGVRPARGLVSIAGFDCFYKHVPAEVIPAMLDGLRRDPQAQMRQFWQRIGLGPEGPGGTLDTGTLRGGLQWLGSWDTEEERKSLGAPILALASEDDMIVRKPMTEAIWGGGNADLRWLASGGHMLPMTHAEWCAEQILDFSRTLE